MERLTLDDMIKALKCVASQDTVGDCYADHENFIHMDDEHKRIVCGTGEDLRDYISGKEAVGCPYYQNDYGCCFDNGELFWLEDVAELLKKQIPEKPQNTSQLIDFCANRYAFRGDCPKCNKIGLYSWNKYCPECGQALDWEEHQKE